MLSMQTQHIHPSLGWLHLVGAERHYGNQIQYRLFPQVPPPLKSNATPAVMCILGILSQPLGCAPWSDYYVSGVHRLKAAHR